MDLKPFADLVRRIRPTTRLDWIKHLNKYPNHVVAVVAIQSVTAAIVTIILAWVTAAHWR